jgi:hypothetical protein
LNDRVFGSIIIFIMKQKTFFQILGLSQKYLVLTLFLLGCQMYRAKSALAQVSGTANSSRIQAEDFDRGGQNITYYDLNDYNEGGQYRPDESVDIENTTDEGGGYNVGWIANGEWLEYTTQIKPGKYNLKVRVASAVSNPGSLQVKAGDRSIANFDINGTGNWQSWQTLTVPNVEITGDEAHRLRLEMGDGGLYNVNWLEFEPVSTVSPTPHTKGKFKVTTDAIIDPDGKKALYSGIIVPGPGMFWSSTILEDKEEITDYWKFNLIRYAIGVTTNYPGHSHDSIDAVVQEFTSRKIPVILATIDNPAANWGDSKFHKGGPYQSWLRDIGTKYKDNPYVWFDVVGENGTCNPCDGTWETVNKELLRVLRDEAGNDNIFISQGNNWGQEGGCGAPIVPEEQSCFLQYGQSIQQFDNKNYFGQGIMYSIHIYDQWNNSYEKFVDYADRMKAKGLHLWMSDDSDWNVKWETTQATEYAMRLRKERNMSSGGIWIWDGDTSFPGEHGKLTTSGTGQAINSASNPTNLTNLGRIVWDFNSWVLDRENSTGD